MYIYNISTLKIKKLYKSFKRYFVTAQAFHIINIYIQKYIEKSIHVSCFMYILVCSQPHPLMITFKRIYTIRGYKDIYQTQKYICIKLDFLCFVHIIHSLPHNTATATTTKREM